LWDKVQAKKATKEKNVPNYSWRLCVAKEIVLLNTNFAAHQTSFW